MSKQPDFQGQRGRLQEEVEATGNLVIFYPKFHCELNFIERYSFFFPLYTPHNLTEPFTDFGVLPNIMLVRTANITWKVCAKRCQKL